VASTPFVGARFNATIATARTRLCSNGWFREEREEEGFGVRRGRKGILVAYELHECRNLLERYVEQKVDLGAFLRF